MKMPSAALQAPDRTVESALLSKCGAQDTDRDVLPEVVLQFGEDPGRQVAVEHPPYGGLPPCLRLVGVSSSCASTSCSRAPSAIADELSRSAAAVQTPTSVPRCSPSRRNSRAASRAPAIRRASGR